MAHAPLLPGEPAKKLEQWRAMRPGTGRGQDPRSRMPGSAPPVYRPGNALLAEGTGQLKLGPGAGAPPVYRPASFLPPASLTACGPQAVQLSPRPQPAPPPVYRPFSAPAPIYSRSIPRTTVVAPSKIASLVPQRAVVRVVQRMMTASEPAVIKIVRTEEGLALTGQLEENGAAISGGVMLEEYVIDPSGTGKTLPVKNGVASVTTARALRVHNIEVKPTKLGLGDFMMLASAQEAVRRHIPYLLAMNCVGAARSWYFRMGFVPYATHRSTEALRLQKQQVEEQIRTAPTLEHTQILLAAHQGIQSDLESVEALAMFAPVGTVITRASGSSQRRWLNVAPDQYFAV